MKRYGGVCYVSNENKEKYIQCHKNVPQEIKKLISNCNIRNYSIFIKGNMLFTYYEYIGDCYSADMQKMAKDANNKKWWEIVVPLLTAVEGEKPDTVWAEMQSVFFQE